MRFIDDHDPLSLLEQMATRYGECVGTAYREREPNKIVSDFIKRG